MAAPESQGMSSEKLDALRESLAAKNTKGFLVVRNDRIVCEWYARTTRPNRKRYTASMAKAAVGAVALAAALSDGKVSLDDPAARLAIAIHRHRVELGANRNAARPRSVVLRRTIDFINRVQLHSAF
jgi:CubicO group peptidase (beta-lactamase class C family)